MIKTETVRTINEHGSKFTKAFVDVCVMLEPTICITYLEVTKKYDGGNVGEQIHVYGHDSLHEEINIHITIQENGVKGQQILIEYIYDNDHKEVKSRCVPYLAFNWGYLMTKYN